MANVNVQLPPIIAAPFPQAAEALHRQNQLQSAIPKTEQTHAYTKMRGDQEREQTAHQSSQILQSGESDAKQRDPSRGFNQRRDFFFARQLKLSREEMNETAVELQGISDFKQVISVIQAKYKNAVSPIPEPSVNFAI